MIIDKLKWENISSKFLKFVYMKIQIKLDHEKSFFFNGIVRVVGDLGWIHFSQNVFYQHMASLI